MVEQVEGLRPEVYFLSLSETAELQGKRLTQREIERCKSGPAKNVAPGIAERSRRIERKRSGVEPLSKLGGLCAASCQIGTTNQIRPVGSDSAVGIIQTRENGIWETSAQCQDAARLPSADHVAAPKAHRFEGGQLPDVGGDKLPIHVDT